MSLNTVSVRKLIMNVENTTRTPSNQPLWSKKWCAKSAALSLSLLLGACATTDNKIETAAEPEAAAVKQVVAKKDQAPAPSAAELMKSLKAPLVEPPEVEQVEKVIAEKPEAVIVENAKQEQAKVLEAVNEDSKEELKQNVEIEAASPAIFEKIIEVKSSTEGSIEESGNKAQQKVDAVSAKAFNVSASKLPFTYDIWTIKQGNTPLTKGLVISTPTWEMGKEGYTSQIWLTMMEDKIHINSSSDIETASKGLGIRIDGGDLIPFSSIADNNIGVISGEWLNTLAAANKLDIYLGFFPGKKPTSETFSSDLSLNNLARIVATYRMLNQ